MVGLGMLYVIQNIESATFESFIGSSLNVRFLSFGIKILSAN